MTNILVIKERLINFFSKFEAYIIPVAKFILTLVMLIVINANIGFMYKLKNPVVVIILALLCSFLPSNTIVLVAGAYVILHIYALSLECAIVVLALFLLAFLLYFRFSPKDTLAVLLMPICFALRIPYVIPLTMGFIGTPMSIVSVSCGTIFYYVIEYIKLNSTTLGNMEVDSAIQKYKYIIDNILNNKMIMLVIVSFSLTIIVIYIIRRLSIDYAWRLALVVGTLINIMIILIGDFVLDVNIDILMTILGTLISCAIVLVLQFFCFNVDYTRTEHVQFEDDEYYYYVKAVPKITLAKPEVKIRRINAQDKTRRN